MINSKVRHLWFFLMFLTCTAGMAAVTMLLWNWLIPAIFGGVFINYWQAIGLLILSRLLFGGFGLHNMHKHWHAHHALPGHHHHGFREMHGMSRQERKEYILRHMKEHGFCCGQEEKERTQDADPK